MTAKGKREIELPALPSGAVLTEGRVYYTARQMLAFAQKAVEDDREAIFSRKGSVPLVKGSISDQIMSVVGDVGLTTAEINELLPGVRSSMMSVYLTNLWKRGHLTRTPVDLPRTGRYGSPPRYLWSKADEH